MAAASSVTFNHCTFNIYAGPEQMDKEFEAGPEEIRAAATLCRLAQVSKPISLKSFYPVGSKVLYQGEEVTIGAWVSQSQIQLTTGSVVEFSDIVPLFEDGDKALIQDCNDRQKHYFEATIDKSTEKTFQITWEGFRDVHGRPVSTFVRKVQNVALRVLPKPSLGILSRIPYDLIQFEDASKRAFGKAYPGYNIRI